MIDIDTRFNRQNFNATLLLFYLRYRPWQIWIIFPMGYAWLVFRFKRIDITTFQARYWQWLFKQPINESRWRRLGQRLVKKSHHKVKSDTWIVAPIPDKLLDWLLSGGRHIGLDLDEQGYPLPAARPLAEKITYLRTDSLVVSPHFYRQIVRGTQLQPVTKIYANRKFFTSFRQYRWHQCGLVTRNIVVLAVLAIITGVATIYMSSAAYDLKLTKMVFTSPTLLLLNFMPIFVIMLIAYALFNRMMLAVFVGQIPAIIVAMVNYFMLQYRDYPFDFADISLASEASNMGARYSYVPPAKYLFVIGSLLLLTVIITLFLKPVSARLNVRLVMVFLLLLGSAYGLSRYYLVDDHYVLANDDPWGPDADRYVVNGYMFAFIHSVKNDWLVPPDNYSADNAKEALNKYQYQSIPADKRINIITVQLEAFQDFSKWSDLDIDPSVYAGLHEVASEGMAGQLTTTIFGGGTIDTERKVLTGFSDMSPINGMTNSFVHYFNEQNYVTRFMHPGDAWFYNRQNIDRYLGFQKTLFRDNYYNQHVSDADVVPDTLVFKDLVKQLKQVNASGKQFFNQTVTMQNHGPYDTAFDGEALLPWKKGYNKKDYAIINNYLTGIKETSDALLELKNELDQLDEPVVLAFWGDHNPWGGDKNSTYKMLGINLKQSTHEGYENYYNTPYVIWSNQAAKKLLTTDFSGTGPTMSPMYMLPEIFTHSGWQGSQFMQVLQKLEQQVPVFGTKNHYMINGALTTKPAKKTEKAIKTYDDIEYYLKSNYLMNQKDLK